MKARKAKFPKTLQPDKALGLAVKKATKGSLGKKHKPKKTMPRKY